MIHDQMTTEFLFSYGTLQLEAVQMANFGRLFWSVGAYFRMSDLQKPVEVGDVYGRFWLRSCVGLDL